MTTIVKTTYEQLIRAGINPRLAFVAWDDVTLKVSKGLNGSLIRYDKGTDLYDVEEYHGFVVKPLAHGVGQGELMDVVMPTLSARRGF
jgi:hypothetical protein